MASREQKSDSERILGLEARIATLEALLADVTRSEATVTFPGTVDAVAYKAGGLSGQNGTLAGAMVTGGLITSLG